MNLSRAARHRDRPGPVGRRPGAVRHRRLHDRLHPADPAAERRAADPTTARDRATRRLAGHAADAVTTPVVDSQALAWQDPRQSATLEDWSWNFARRLRRSSSVPWGRRRFRDAGDATRPAVHGRSARRLRVPRRRRARLAAPERPAAGRLPRPPRPGAPAGPRRRHALDRLDRGAGQREPPYRALAGAPGDAAADQRDEHPPRPRRRRARRRDRDRGRGPSGCSAAAPSSPTTAPSSRGRGSSCRTGTTTGS